MSNIEKSHNSYLPRANVEVCSYFNVWKDGFLEINVHKTTLIWSHFLGGHLCERLTWTYNHCQVPPKHPQFNTTLDFSRQICHTLQEASQAVWSTQNMPDYQAEKGLYAFRFWNIVFSTGVVTKDASFQIYSVLMRCFSAMFTSCTHRRPRRSMCHWMNILIFTWTN